MPAYCRFSLRDFLAADPRRIVGELETQRAQDGYATQFSAQTRAWAKSVPLLQSELSKLIAIEPRSERWGVLLEFPLYRLRRRIDVVILTDSVVVVLELKVGETRFQPADERQVEEYALDLRDFHAQSYLRPLLPILWATHAPRVATSYVPGPDIVAPVHHVGQDGLADLLAQLPRGDGHSIVAEAWDDSEYRPVPNIIQAATSIFAGHGVRAIAQADAENLQQAASRILELIADAKRRHRRALIFLTGVPGSGKTLAGLSVVHDAIATGAGYRGDIVYLSGNTPLVVVLREALARDEYARKRNTPQERPLADVRREVRARIQHINDFLKEALAGSSGSPPHEHAIVFDEAQRAWDERQGEKKFSRTASEPALLLDLMGRHKDWCACVCLVGGGQEINTGEQGVAGWGDALRQLSKESAREWSVFGPQDVFSGGPSTGGLQLDAVPEEIEVTVEPNLQLQVPIRSYRSPRVSDWVAFMLDGKDDEARRIAKHFGNYPLLLTRSLDRARQWLRQAGRGERRYGLVASSGARRLRADGLGVVLSANDGIEIAHWYLNPPGDIRASYALEVPANEYTCQGLELDFVGLCWGGNLVRDARHPGWLFRKLNGAKWQRVDDPRRRRFISNGYRVLLTRAREGLIIWVPEGDPDDPTREPELFQATADYLLACGVVPLESAG